IASALLTIPTLFRLFMDWMNVYTDLPTAVINFGFATGLFCARCLLWTRYLAQREGDLYYLGGITNRQFRRLLLVTALVLYYVTGALELYIQCNGRLPDKELSVLYLTLYTTAFSLFFFLWLPRLRVEPVLVLLVGAIPFTVYLSNTVTNYGTEVRLLTGGTGRASFWANWADDPLLLSLELQHLFVWIYYTNPASIEHAADLYSKAGLSILWGVCAFALITIGLSHRYKPLRVIALFLFGLTLLKLFCYD